ncbi:ABC transporter permease [Thermophilibacter immobilis]|uniref:ABC transporter permease n=1 Tax=Thermophilibacter immobilis TaxID=2779519 RepID=A0A7S7M9B5_9ACTN|nr:ABC transporter permease [Thermophilibacter immobilis]QOY61105.1 ABC transporter permease [Thermophilibacter immobilis]
MRIRDLLYETFTAISANRVRSLLTVLGIVIGIGAVIAITSLIDGMKMQLVSQLGLNMSRMVSITCWPPGNQPLDEADIEKIGQDLASDYEFVTGYTYTGSPASSTTADVDMLQVTACRPEYFTGMGITAERGRLFSADEVEDGGMVVVLGGSSVKNLFGSPDADAVGQTVRIGNDRYTVIGTVADAMGYQDNPLAYLPTTTATTRLIGQQVGSYWDIIGFAHEGMDMYAVAADTDSYLRTRYEIGEADPNGGGNSDEGFVDVRTAQEAIDQLDQTMASFRMLALAVASVSLLVGGIGIMNMMLTNVTERIREIGLRKALGARSADVTKQFLLESVLLCLVGGVFGIAAGYGGAWALAGVAGGALGYDNLVPIVSPEAVAIATGICVGIGVLFGWYPARRAARLDPVESLRYQ